MNCVFIQDFFVLNSKLWITCDNKLLNSIKNGLFFDFSKKCLLAGRLVDEVMMSGVE